MGFLCGEEFMCFFILLIYICFSCLSSKKVLKSLNGIQNQLWVTSEVRTRTNGKYHKEPILTTWVTKQWSDLPGQVVISHSWKYASARGPEVMCEHIHTHTHKHIHTRTHTCTHTNYCLAVSVSLGFTLLRCLTNQASSSGCHANIPVDRKSVV